MERSIGGIVSSARTGAILLGAAAAFVACADRAADQNVAGGGVVLRDSAGISIVEHADLRTADSTAWHLDTTPVLRIGHLEHPAHFFSRISGATRLPDGRIVAADPLTAELRYFDSRGKHLGTSGRIGQGPDEYENFRSLRRFTGDSLLVEDYEGLRSSVATADGRVVRRFRPSIIDSAGRRRNMSRVQAVFGDGSILLTERVDACSGIMTRGICVDSTRFTRVRESGEVATAYGVLATSRYDRQPAPREVVGELELGPMAAIPTYQPQFHWTVRGDDLFYGDAQRFEIHVIGGRGAVHRIIRVQEPLFVTPRWKVLAPPGVVPGTSEAFDAARERAAPRAFDGMTTDMLGCLWVRQREHESQTPYLDSPLEGRIRWFVFDATGVLRHTLTMQPSLGTLLEIGADYMLFSVYGEDLVPQVVMRRLHRGTLAHER